MHRPRSRCGGPALLLVLAGLTLGLAVPTSPAAEPDQQARRGRLDVLRYYEQARQYAQNLRKPEVFEMITAIPNLAQMGPGDGWFHGSASRYGWSWLAQRHGKGRSDSVTRKEFKGSPELFDRLDRNHDGVLTAGDFDWSDRSVYAMQGMPSTYWFRQLDANTNGRISRDEWLAAFKKAAKGKDYLTQEDLRDLFPVSPPPRPPGPPPKFVGPDPVVLYQGLLSGELGSIFEGPSVGERAPNFALRTQDGQHWLNMSEYRGDKPLVLVFGSFT